MSTEANKLATGELGGVVVGTDAHWYAIRTRSRHEKMAAQQLGMLGIENFLPLVTQTHRWSTGPKMVDVPLFSGYAFVRITYTPEHRLRVLRTHGVVDFVGVQLLLDVGLDAAHFLDHGDIAGAGAEGDAVQGPSRPGQLSAA